jgi:hypothetical protein
VAVVSDITRFVDDSAVFLCAAIAAREFGGKGDGMFTTGAFQTAVRTMLGLADTPSETLCTMALCRPGIVRHGDCYWQLVARIAR